MARKAATRSVSRRKRPATEPQKPIPPAVDRHAIFCAALLDRTERFIHAAMLLPLAGVPRPDIDSHGHLPGRWRNQYLPAANALSEVLRKILGWFADGDHYRDVPPDRCAIGCGTLTTLTSSGSVDLLWGLGREGFQCVADIKAAFQTILARQGLRMHQDLRVDLDGEIFRGPFIYREAEPDFNILDNIFGPAPAVDRMAVDPVALKSIADAIGYKVVIPLPQVTDASSSKTASGQADKADKRKNSRKVSPPEYIRDFDEFRDGQSGEIEPLARVFCNGNRKNSRGRPLTVEALLKAYYRAKTGNG